MTSAHKNRRGASVRILLITSLFVGGWALPTGAQGTSEDYERAGKLRELTTGKVFRAAVRPRWAEDGARFWYRNDLAGRKREYVLVDAAKGTRGKMFDHAKLAAALGKAAGEAYDAERLALDEFAMEGETVRFNVGEKGWKYDPNADSVTAAEPLKRTEPDRAAPANRGRGGDAGGRGSRSGEKSPDGKWAASIKENNVFLKSADEEQPAALTTDGSAEEGYDTIWWSPDSSKLVAMKTKKAEEHKVYLIESSPKDQLQPKLHSFDYLKPGDRVAVRKPHLFDVASRKEISVSNELFANPWSVSNVRWEPDSKRFTFMFNQRGHQALRLLAVDATSGTVAPIIDEQSKTFIDYSGKMYIRYLDETNEAIWMSERYGWNHLYLIDMKSGQVKNPITNGEWIVRNVDRVDGDKRQIWFRAGGIRPGQDPYYVHHCRVNFDGTGLTILTEGDGTHEVQPSPDGKYLIDTYSRVDQPPVTELRRAEDGSRICELERGDWSELLQTGWTAPERFSAKARDGTTDIFGVIWRPMKVDPARKYPVIEQIYAGPQGSFVPKAFASYFAAQSLAELGFIVVQIDGMGTSNRSKAFHDVCWKNLADAGFPDRILWMKAAAEKYPYMDLSRVGVYGGSAGGQNSTGALLTHPQFYKVAVSDCGCHDNRMDKIWWNEQWMGWPIEKHYEEQSNVTMAHKLEGKLLLMYGELDRNVDPASTVQVVNALIKANKDFDLVIFPGAGHGAGGSPYGVRRRNDFFVRHLLGAEPRGH